MLITLAVTVGILLLPYLFPDRQKSVSEPARLRAQALSRNLLPIPKEPEGMLALVEPPEHRLTPRKVVLRRRLFFDPGLSRDRTLTCASCHILEEGGDDNRPTAIGYHGRANPFHHNSPTVLNAALEAAQSGTAGRRMWRSRRVARSGPLSR